MNLHACRRSLWGGCWLAGRRIFLSTRTNNNSYVGIDLPKIANGSSIANTFNLNEGHDHEIRRRLLPLQLLGHACRRNDPDKELRVVINSIGFHRSAEPGVISGQHFALDDYLDGDGDGDGVGQQKQKHGWKQSCNATSSKKKGGGSFIHFDLQLDLSPIYPTLPNDATKHTCVSVYDGDTLTLKDATRVRLLGIDTPEIKGNEAYSQEAKQYTTDYCQGKEIFLICLEGSDSYDRYGRLLAHVWVRLTGKGGWLCVNEGLVVSGLAHVYSPSNTKKVHNFNKLVGQQWYAQMLKLGIWNTFVDYDVTVTPKGRAFHTSDCNHLRQSTSLSVLPASKAYNMGRHPCRDCSPNTKVKSRKR